MEARIIEYPRSDYQHNSSPLIGEIPNNEYTHFHRSIDQLRSLNERGILNSNHFQNVLVPTSTSSIVVPSGVYSEIKLSEDTKIGNDFQSTNKSLRRNEEEKNSSDVGSNSFRIIHSPQEYSIATSPSVQTIQQNQNGFVSIDISHNSEIKSKVHVKKKCRILFKFSIVLKNMLQLIFKQFNNLTI